jgi:murein DD-endopeptidase MepM/ murein hydrolase activator NlpD
VQHGGNITTLYAHMSKFNNSARVGRRVIQGQTIGYVGKTGLATAPHLHYEYRLNGVHRNPRTVKLPQAAPIKDEYRNDFLATVEPILNELLQYKRTLVASLSLD